MIVHHLPYESKITPWDSTMAHLDLCSLWSRSHRSHGSSGWRGMRGSGRAELHLAMVIHYFVSIQWPFQEPKLEVPTIYKAYVRPKFPGISPQNMALYGTVPPF